MGLVQQAGIAAWRLRGRFGWQVPLNREGALTVLVAYYHPARTRYCAAQVRSLLKCAFIERVIISNHNPLVRLELPARLRDKRITMIQASEKRGCGHRWHVAAAFNPRYLLVIDDDVFLFPEQIARLFGHLLDAPERPHGMAGMRRLPDGRLEYHCQKNLDVDFLCEAYAVTLGHLQRYLKLEDRLRQNGVSLASVDGYADFAVVSHTGTRRPAIHDLGHIFRCPSFKTPGIAVHRTSGFEEAVGEVVHALDILDASGPPRPASAGPAAALPSEMHQFDGFHATPGSELGTARSKGYAS